MVEGAIKQTLGCGHEYGQGRLRAVLYTKIKNLLPQHVVVGSDGKDHSKELDGTDVLIVDDAALSGINLAATIEALFPMGKTTSAIAIAITVITAIGTKVARDVLSSLHHFYPTVAITFIPVVTIAAPVLPQDEKAGLVLSPHTEALLGYAIHFEHKIPNQFGSFPLIYQHGRDSPTRKLYEGLTVLG